VRAAQGDTVQLVEEIISNEIDVAIVALPVNDLRLHLGFGRAEGGFGPAFMARLKLRLQNNCFFSVL
jgi:hypothetical protein